MQNWFPTLNEALGSEDLLPLWELGLNINYDETKTCIKDGRYISIYRDGRGMYERPVHYGTKMMDSW